MPLLMLLGTIAGISALTWVCALTHERMALATFERPLLGKGVNE